MGDRHISIDYNERDATRRRDPKRSIKPKKGRRKNKQEIVYDFLPPELEEKRRYRRRRRS